MIKGIEAIGFDLDGTLYKLTKEMNDRIRNLMAEKLFEHDPSLESVSRARDFFERRYAVLESGKKVLGEAGIKDPFSVAEYCLANARVLEWIVPNPELADTMEAISSSYPQVYLLSSSPTELGLAKLEKIRISEGVFGNMVFSDTNGAGIKRNGEAFRYVVNALGIPPRNHLYVGDRESSDILPAKRLGMKTLMVGRESQEADYSIEDINDVGGFLL